MSRQDAILRHRHIIHQLTKKPSSFQEIQNFLRFQEEMSGGRQFTCSIRTFQRNIKEIEENYNVVIQCDRSRNEYYIAEDGREVDSERLMESFDLFNAIRMGNSFGKHLIFENRKALGTEHMHGLLHAIRNKFEVKFFYKKFDSDSDSDSVSERIVRPVAIKESRNRWYLLGQDSRDDKIKNFGLDRISALEILKKKFREIKNYDPLEEFQHIFGIINGTGEEPQKIILSFTPTEGRYVRSLPLHKSQQEIFSNKEEIRFQYLLVPTYDLKMEILSHGNQVKVLEPESLRKEIAEQLKLALSAYE